MNTIYKYELALQTHQIIEMPQYTEILTVQMQGENICLWANVDTEYSLAPRTIVIAGTGEPLLTAGLHTHIATIQMGIMVWHFFEVIE